MKLIKYVQGSEYPWIIHGFWKCLNIHEYVQLYQDFEYAWICRSMPKMWENVPNISNIVDLAEYAWNITCLNKPGI